MAKTAIKEIVIVYIIRILAIDIVGIFSADEDIIFAAVMVISDIVLYYRLYILKPQEMKHPKIKINYIILADCILWTGISISPIISLSLWYWDEYCLRLHLFIAGCAGIIINAVVHFLAVI